MALTFAFQIAHVTRKANKVNELLTTCDNIESVTTIAHPPLNTLEYYGNMITNSLFKCINIPLGYK